MLGLGAVQPDGGGVVDENGVGWDLSIRSLDRHETREDTSDSLDRSARRIESRLGDSVVGWAELELDHISDGCYNVVWRIDEGSVVASHLNYVYLDTSGGGGGGC